MRNRKITAGILLVVLLLVVCGCKATSDSFGIELVENGSFDTEDSDLPDGWQLTGWDLSDSTSTYQIVSIDDRTNCVYIIIWGIAYCIWFEYWFNFYCFNCVNWRFKRREKSCVIPSLFQPLWRTCIYDFIISVQTTYY